MDLWWRWRRCRKRYLRYGIRWWTMRNQDESTSHWRAAPCSPFSGTKTVMATDTTTVTFGQTLKSPRSIFGGALRTVISSIISIKLATFSMKGGAMHQVRKNMGRKHSDWHTSWTVHSLGAGLFLETDQIHYFEDIGYQHDLYRHCPSKESGKGCRCSCPVGTSKESIDHDNYYDTCLPQWRKWVKTSEARKARWWSS